MLSFIGLKVRRGVGVVFAELLHNVLAHVAVVLLNCTSDDHLVFWWDDRCLSSFSEEVLHKGANVSTRNGDMFDGRAYDVTLGLPANEYHALRRQPISRTYHRNDVGHTIT